MIKVTRCAGHSRFNVEHKSQAKGPITTKSFTGIGPLHLIKHLSEFGVSEDHIQAAYRSLKVLKTSAVYFNRRMEFIYAIQ